MKTGLADMGGFHAGRTMCSSLCFLVVYFVQGMCGLILWLKTKGTELLTLWDAKEEELEGGALRVGSCGVLFSVSGSLSRVCPGEKVRFTYTLCSDLACEPVFRAPCRQCLSERWNGAGCAGATGEATKADQVAAPGLMGLMGDYEDDDD